MPQLISKKNRKIENIAAAVKSSVVAGAEQFYRAGYNKAFPQGDIDWIDLYIDNHYDLDDQDGQEDDQNDQENQDNQIVVKEGVDRSF